MFSQCTPVLILINLLVKKYPQSKYQNIRAPILKSLLFQRLKYPSALTENEILTDEISDRFIFIYRNRK